MVQIRISLLSTMFFLILSLTFVIGCGTESKNDDDGLEQFDVHTLPADVSSGGDGISVAPNGDIYLSGGLGNKNVYRITSEEDVAVFATGFTSANGSDFDSDGNLYVADYQANRIRKITIDGTVSTFAKNLDGPAGVYVDPDNYVYVGLYGANFSGRGSKVLKISPDGEISAYAQGGGLQDVIGVAGDGNGRIFTGTYSQGKLFEITDGEVTQLADLDGQVNMIEYSDEYIYIPDPQSHKIHRMDLEGNVQTIAGSGEAGSLDSLGTAATFNRPNSCGVSPDGKVLYIYDTESGNLRKMGL